MRHTHRTNMDPRWPSCAWYCNEVVFARFFRASIKQNARLKDRYIQVSGTRPRSTYAYGSTLPPLSVSRVHSLLHAQVGWPAYLLFGATGGPSRGMTSHFFPHPPFATGERKTDLFPGQWKKKVWMSNVGVAGMIGCLAAWAAKAGGAQVAALYGGPLMVVNAWLVLITWLQHTEVDVPHFDAANWSFIKGALHTVDRPYGKVLDFLHHRIGSTHVAHHVSVVCLT